MRLTFPTPVLAQLGLDATASAREVQAAVEHVQSVRAQAELRRAEQAPSTAGPGVTPLVTKLAAQLNVDLSGVTGSGVGGRVRPTDVRQAAGLSGARTATSQAMPISMEQQISALSDDQLLALIGISSGGAAADPAAGGPSLTGPDINALTDEQVAELWS